MEIKKDKKLTDRELTIGIAHDYVGVELDGVDIHIPIIFMYEVLKKLQESGFCTPQNMLWHSYQIEYAPKCRLWCQDLGNFKLIPVVEKRTMVSDIKVERIEK